MFSYLMISNKLLLLSMKQIRRDSMNNLNNLSYVRVTDALDSTPGSAVVSTNRSTIRRPMSAPRFRPTLETIHDQPPESTRQDASPSHSLQGSYGKRLGSITHVPQGDSENSLYAIYGMNTQNSALTLSSPLEGSPHPHTPHHPSPTTLPISNSTLSLGRRDSLSFSARSHPEDWIIPPRTKLRILAHRIIRCLRRDYFYLIGHTLCAIILGVAIGVFFWQLPHDMEGITRRYQILHLCVFYALIQGISARIWYRNDCSIFIRDARCGYISPLSYFTIVSTLDSVVNRVLPSTVFVRNSLDFYYRLFVLCS